MGGQAACGLGPPRGKSRPALPRHPPARGGVSPQDCWDRRNAAPNAAARGPVRSCPCSDTSAAASRSSRSQPSWPTAERRSARRPAATPRSPRDATTSPRGPAGEPRRRRRRHPARVTPAARPGREQGRGGNPLLYVPRVDGGLAGQNAADAADPSAERCRIRHQRAQRPPPGPGEAGLDREIRAGRGSLLQRGRRAGQCWPAWSSCFSLGPGREPAGAETVSPGPSGRAGAQLRVISSVVGRPGGAAGLRVLLGERGVLLGYGRVSPGARSARATARWTAGSRTGRLRR